MEISSQADAILSKLQIKDYLAEDLPPTLLITADTVSFNFFLLFLCYEFVLLHFDKIYGHLSTNDLWFSVRRY